MHAVRGCVHATAHVTNTATVSANATRCCVTLQVHDSALWLAVLSALHGTRQDRLALQLLLPLFHATAIDGAPAARFDDPALVAVVQDILHAPLAALDAAATSGQAPHPVWGHLMDLAQEGPPASTGQLAAATGQARAGLALLQRVVALVQAYPAAPLLDGGRYAVGFAQHAARARAVAAGMPAPVAQAMADIATVLYHLAGDCAAAIPSVAARQAATQRVAALWALRRAFKQPSPPPPCAWWLPYGVMQYAPH
jgi:hypothetical protein